jgi:Tol biopolymer transport system component
MTPERWKQIEELFQAARERGVETLSGVDPELRAEVEKLLAGAGTRDDLLDIPNRPLTESGVSGLPRLLGPYRLESMLGRGGMGEVYKATDTRLNRPVAIKLCDPGFLEYFQREVKAISALNHPHICTLYDAGPDYLVMELIEGETLASRIRKGPLTLEEVSRYGAEIADALAEAHSAGIVHRDLKPGNIMITRRGVKVLDFGLAKSAASGQDWTQSYRLAGTPAYMAPEQVSGKGVDPRTDLFALGLVLFEMVTGRTPFPGASLGNMLASDDSSAIPKPSQIRDRTFSPLDPLILKLLDANPEKRVQQARTVAHELQALNKPGSTRIPKVGIVVAAAVAVLMLTLLWLSTRTREVQKLDVAGVVAITNLTGKKLDPAYSPDGKSIAFSWLGEDGKSPGIYLLDRDARAPHRLTHAPSTARDIAPAWSPDGSEIAFKRQNPEGANELMVVRVRDGSARKLRDVRQPAFLTNSARPLLTWTPDGRAIVIPAEDADASGRASLFRIGVHGEPPQRLFQSTAGQGDAYPAFSPDGRWLAYGLADRASTRLFVRRAGPGGMPEGSPQEVPGGAGTILAPVHSTSWSPDSRRLLFWASGKLMEWEPGGMARELWVSEAIPQTLSTYWTGGVLSELVYANNPDRFELRELRLDAQGRHAEGPAVEFMHRGSIACPQFSPNGRWVSFCDRESLWIATSDGENPRQLTKKSVGAGAHFSPDSLHFAFHNPDEFFAPLWVVDLDASGAKVGERLITQRDSFSLVGASWSGDGSTSTPPRSRHHGASCGRG